MPTTLSTPSTTHPEGSLGGVLRTNFTQPWNRSLFDTIFLGRGFTQAPNYLSNFLGWQHSIKGATVTHIFVCDEPFDHASEWPTSLQYRALCYHLLDRLPDAGIEEALSTLSDYWEFYSSLPPATPALPKRNEVGGKFMGTVERSPLFIDEG